MSATDGLDPAALALLSPQEIEAMNAEPSPEELVVMRQDQEAKQLIAEEGDDPDDSNESNPGNDNPDNGSTAASDADPTSQSNPAPTDNPAANIEQPDVRATYRADLPENFQAQLDELKSQKAEIAQKFKDGDIDLDEFTELNDGLQEKRDALNSLKLKAEIAQEMGAQTAQQEWVSTVKKFVADVAKADGIDYSKDAVKQADFDAFLKVLAGNPANDGKSSQWFLQEAHKRTLALHEIAPSKAKQTEKPNRKPPVDSIPANLAHVAGSDGPGDTGGDEFSEIDKLVGMDLEKAIAAMSPTQREKYLAGA